MRQAAWAGLLCLLTGATPAADYQADPDTYRDYLPLLAPGDRLRLAPGDYLKGLPLHNLSGSEGRPIVVEAALPASPPRFIGRPHANTVSLVNVRHVVLRHLELDGRNVPVDALKAEGHSRYADFVTLEHLHIHDHAASQQNVGISTKCPTLGWRILSNRIERVGTGIYLGDSDGSDPFVGGVIEGNRISDTLGYNLQIKHQKARPTEIGERHETVIRYNVFSKQGARPGPQARPNVLLGHLPLSGAGSEDRYLVHGNLFLHNPSEALLQAEGRVTIYDNFFINGDGDAVHIQPHNDVPRDMLIHSNTVLASGSGIQVRRSPETSYRQRVLANVVAALQPLRGGEASYNVSVPYRPDCLALPPEQLTSCLLANVAGAQPLPAKLMDELAGSPGWARRSHPGAVAAPGLLGTLQARP